MRHSSLIAHLHDLHAFPTRRSSDLGGVCAADAQRDLLQPRQRPQTQYQFFEQGSSNAFRSPFISHVHAPNLASVVDLGAVPSKESCHAEKIPVIESS